MTRTIFSKKCLLLLGSGELGKEILIESQRLGCKTIAVDKYADAPAMQVADESFVLNMSDKESLKNLILKLKPDYVVPEIESLSIEALKEIEDKGIKIVPNARTVEMTMNRDKIRDLASKELEIKTAKYKYVFDYENLNTDALIIGFPLILKPLMSSSGKGQNVVDNEDDLLEAWNQALKCSRGDVKGVILEEFIDFDFEFTLLSVRNNSGKNIFCPPIGHEQNSGDYQCSWQPLELCSSLLLEAKNITSKILDNLDGAGLYGVEFFVKGNELIFSELSPRPHDTGLVTLLSQNINEFELHLRALLNLPIPEIKLINIGASRVLLSNEYYESHLISGLAEALEINSTKVLIFGKKIARKNRRMGVVLATGQNILEARSRADESASKISIISSNDP